MLSNFSKNFEQKWVVEFLFRLPYDFHLLKFVHVYFHEEMHRERWDTTQSPWPGLQPWQISMQNPAQQLQGHHPTPPPVMQYSSVFFAKLKVNLQFITTMTNLNTCYLFKQSPDNSVILYLRVKRAKYSLVLLHVQVLK